MQGILNMTLNSFANEDGTITQKNGIMTWMNGTSYETATEAVRISGGAIGVSNKKDGNGDWVWSTAITGIGINAKAIVAKTFDALEIKGSNIVAGSIKGSNISGVTVSGSTIISGTKESGSYIELDSDGNIIGKKDGVKVFYINVQLGPNPQIEIYKHDGSGYIMIGPNFFDGQEWFGINCYGGDLNISTNAKIHLEARELEVSCDNTYFRGNLYDRQKRPIWGEGE